MRLAAVDPSHRFLCQAHPAAHESCRRVPAGDHRSDPAGVFAKVLSSARCPYSEGNDRPLVRSARPFAAVDSGPSVGAKGRRRWRDRSISNPPAPEVRGGALCDLGGLRRGDGSGEIAVVPIGRCASRRPRSLSPGAIVGLAWRDYRNRREALVRPAELCSRCATNPIRSSAGAG
jgi:hypothetical protein